MKQSKVKTKDGPLTIFHDQKITDRDLEAFEQMTFREFYHVGKVRGFRAEEQ